MVHALKLVENVLLLFKMFVNYYFLSMVGVFAIC